MTKYKFIYIAGPMTGYESFNYPAFEKMEKQLIDAFWCKPDNILNPIRIADGDTTKPYSFYIRESIKMIENATDVVFLDGWEKSKGAVLEYHIAKTMGLNMLDQNLYPLPENLTFTI
jgi:hypothetical protein